MSKYIISTDSSSDYYKTFMKENNIYCIVMKRVLNGQEIGEIYDSADEYDKFYNGIKNGDKPSTVAINPQEFRDHFETILSKEKEGDIVHVALSSGLSCTFDNAKSVADEMNRTLKGRKIYIVDSLLTSDAIKMLVEKLMELNDGKIKTPEAIKIAEDIRDHQQVFIVVDDLFHLKRGGRISGAKAVIGSLLNIKPVLILNHEGRLVIESKQMGAKRAIQYILDKAKSRTENSLGLLRTSKSPFYDEFKKAARERFPDAKTRDGVIGTIVGSHLGCGAIAILFLGGKRLEIK